jgi:GT2 family glycosyltransferase
VTVCTYRRNEQLRALLDGLVAASDVAADRCEVAVVVVDDTAEGLAKEVADAFHDRFSGGVHYFVSGQQNISIARNIALEAGIAIADWVVSTDDDCVPSEDWLVSLLSMQERTGAHAVTGRLVRRAPSGAPKWLVEQPVLEQGLDVFEDGTEMTTISTHNSMISAEWLREHAHVRFDPRLGRLGGEDMVFGRAAHAAGLTIRYSLDAVVFEDQVEERCTFRYLLRNSLWLGNSQFVTMKESGRAGRLRLVGHGVREAQRSLWRPVARLISGRPPHFRFAFLGVVRAAGLILGSAGARINHH